MVSSANLVWPMDFPARCPRLARCTMQMGFDSFRRRFDASTRLSFQSASRFSSFLVTHGFLGISSNATRSMVASVF